jgi:acetoacetate decarboxylase
MPVDDDMGMVGGRETYGYPKKMADKIKLEQDGNNISGSVVRKGVEILKIEGKLGDETSENPFGDSAKSVKDWDGVLSYRLLSFLFKYFISPGGSSFDYIPRLIREPILLRRISKTLKVSGKVILSSTPVDPLGEIPVGEITSMFYGKWHNTMLPGKVVARIWNPLKFVKNAYFKTDVVPTLLSNYDPNSLARYKEVMKIAKRF